MPPVITRVEPPTTPPVTTSVEPPTVSPVTPSVELETLSAVLDLMGQLLPKLQSCCCGLDMPENLTASTPAFGSGKILHSSSKVFHSEGNSKWIT